MIPRRWMGFLIPLGLSLAQTYTVVPGDTLYSIARRYGTTVEELMRLNGLETFFLKVGQVLLLPPGRFVKDSQNAKAQSDQFHSPSEASGPRSDEGMSVDSRSDAKRLRSSEQVVGKEGADDLDPESPLLKAVLKYLGLTYKYGANSPLAMDCSAFVAQVYAELGVALPRTSWEMYQALPPVPEKTLLPGDLVFFSFSGKEVDHVGVYLGRGVFAHASSYGSRVVIESLEAPFYQRAYRGARRPASLVKAQEIPPR